jgi:hypothetical protein
MIGKDRELLTPMRGCLRSSTLLAAAISTRVVLVAVFFVYVTVLNPSGSGSDVRPESEIPAAAASVPVRHFSEGRGGRYRNSRQGLSGKGS